MLLHFFKILFYLKYVIELIFVLECVRDFSLFDECVWYIKTKAESVTKSEHHTIINHFFNLERNVCKTKYNHSPNIASTRDRVVCSSSVMADFSFILYLHKYKSEHNVTHPTKIPQSKLDLTIIACIRCM